MGTTFQNTVNFYPAGGVAGNIAADSPMRANAYILSSLSGVNTVGKVFTIVSGGNPDNTNSSPIAGIATMGGTGIFAGILSNPNQYALYGANNQPLSPTLNLPNNSHGSLVTMGKMWVYLDNLPVIGDLVTYDPATGNLSSIPQKVSVTGSIALGGAGTADVLTVTAVQAGMLQVGMIIEGAGIPTNTYIASLGTGKGYTGTYNLNTINTLTFASGAIKATNKPAPAVSLTGTISGTTLTVSAISSGQIYVGMALNGSGIASDTVITALGTGTGGTGTYTINNTQTIASPTTITNTANILVPNAYVSDFDITQPGLAKITLTN